MFNDVLGRISEKDKREVCLVALHHRKKAYFPELLRRIRRIGVCQISVLEDQNDSHRLMG